MQDFKEAYRKQVNELATNLKQVEKQKIELLNGFKKQMQLIDVLKKQKVSFILLKKIKIFRNHLPAWIYVSKKHPFSISDAFRSPESQRNDRSRIPEDIGLEI